MAQGRSGICQVNCNVTDCRLRDHCRFMVRRFGTAELVVVVVVVVVVAVVVCLFVVVVCSHCKIWGLFVRQFKPNLKVSQSQCLSC